MNLRSKNECGAPGKLSKRCSTPACGECPVEVGDRLGRDRRIRAAEEPEDRRAEVGGVVHRRRDVVPRAEAGVEADDTGEVEAERGRQERDLSAEAEADRVDRVVGAGRPQMGDRRADVGAHLVVRDALHVLLVREVFGPAAGRAGGAPEPVDGQRAEAVLGEPARQLLVVRVQAADVGEDQHGRRRITLRRGLERGEPRPVGGLEDERTGRGDRPVAGQDRRAAAPVEAHQVSSFAASSSSARRVPPCAGGSHAYSAYLSWRCCRSLSRSCSLCASSSSWARSSASSSAGVAGGGAAAGRLGPPRSCRRTAVSGSPWSGHRATGARGRRPRGGQIPTHGKLGQIAGLRGSRSRLTGRAHLAEISPFHAPKLA